MDATIKNHINTKLKDNQTPSSVTLMKKENNFHGYGKNLAPHHIYESNHLYHYKIINEKEAKVFTKADMLDSSNY